MRDIKTELMQAVERHSGVEPPSLDLLAAKVARRRLHRRTLGAVSVCSVVIAAGILVWNVVVSGSGSDQEPATAPPSTYFNVPTTSWKIGIPGKLANISGVLKFTADDCPFIETSGRPNMVLAFPEGSRGAVSKGGERSVVGPTGDSYGSEGQEVNYAGSYITKGPITNTCAGPNQQAEYFSVQQAPGN